MSAKVKLEPDLKYNYPSNRNYFDESKSTVAKGKVFDETKRAADYGIEDVEVTKPATVTTPGE